VCAVADASHKLKTFYSAYISSALRTIVVAFLAGLEKIGDPKAWPKAVFSLENQDVRNWR
jgi:hypothetical protein